jgi:hypothetical protein
MQKIKQNKYLFSKDCLITGDVVAQLAGMSWLSKLRHLDEPECNAVVPGSIPAYVKRD